MVAEKEMEEKARQSFFEVFGAAEKGNKERSVCGTPFSVVYVCI